MYIRTRNIRVVYRTRYIPQVRDRIANTFIGNRNEEPYLVNIILYDEREEKQRRGNSSYYLANILAENEEAARSLEILLKNWIGRHHEADVEFDTQNLQQTIQELQRTTGVNIGQDLIRIPANNTYYYLGTKKIKDEVNIHELIYQFHWN